jgi:Ion channel
LRTPEVNKIGNGSRVLFQVSRAAPSLDSDTVHERPHDEFDDCSSVLMPPYSRSLLQSGDVRIASVFFVPSFWNPGPMFLITLAGIAIVLLVLVDSFETTVLPRRVTHRFRFARFYYLGTWRVWRAVALRLPSRKWREAFLSLFGPLSLLGLLVTWVIGLILGFAVVHWSAATRLQLPDSNQSFSTYFYWSGGTFFTLGYGDVTPSETLGRVLAVAEAGLGFGFLAMIIGYLPVIYQTYSRREVLIGLLDARAGSPPSAAELILRVARSGDIGLVDPFLAECERWAAELLESHLSFPVLSYYRSQHDNQSWLAALSAILDATAVLTVGVKGHNSFQSRLTFAMARHAAVDLALIFKTPPLPPDSDRLPDGLILRLHKQLNEAGVTFVDEDSLGVKLAELRAMYEPFVNALAQRFLLALPPFVSTEPTADNWQRSAWMKRAPRIVNLSNTSMGDSHFN